MKKSLWLLGIICGLLGQASAQWVRQTNGLPEEFSGSTIDACSNTCAVFGGGTQLFRTSDSGESWQELSWPYESIMDVAMVDETTLCIATINGRIMVSNDAGQTWSIAFDDASQTGFMNYIEMFDAYNGVAMGDAPAADKPALFLRTSDGGETWESMNESFFIGLYSGDTWLRLDFINKDIGYFYASGSSPQLMYKTTDGGRTWAETNFTGYPQVMKFYDENLGLTYNNGTNVAPPKMQRTTDGGVTWEIFYPETEGWGNDIEFIPGDPSQVWLSDGYYLYFSADTGRTWHREVLRPDPDKLWVRDIVFTDSQNGWVACEYGYLYHTANNGGVTSITEHKAELPVAFHLGQNYPNPFNPVTTIVYEIPKTSQISIEVFNTLGERIATLANERREPGTYSVSWNGTTDAGKKVPSGIYIYRLKTGKVVKSRTMLLLQ